MSVTDYREIRKLLVANRGEIARRVIRTCRGMGIGTVAVCSDVDVREPFVREADEAVRIGGSTPAQSYLRIDAIIDAAVRTGADAIHPGYGFLAENADFARACNSAGIVFVGPSPEAIEVMGSKRGAKRMLSAAGVPILADIDVSDLSDEDLTAAGNHVEYPLLVKPSAGGGGKGMRVVRTAADLLPAVHASRREARAAFGDDTMLLEKYVERGRHVEIQILGDDHGNLIHLGERECSVQRRHQKVLEESPSVAVDSDLRQRMGSSAIAAGKAIGYVGAGTVEFLLTDEGAYYFLEVNTRLQVEHPVTEQVTGIDLVRAQIEIAAGGHVPTPPTTRGHAIEVRLYAEDPRAGFLPQTGHIDHLRIPGHPAVRVDAGVESGSDISINYDPMIAKVIAHAPTRGEAAHVLAMALREAEIDGLQTNRDFLVRLLEHPAFVAGEIDTGFLDREDIATLCEPLVRGDEMRRYAACAALATQAARRAGVTAGASLPTGWRSHWSQPQQTEFDVEDETVRVAYGFRRGSLQLLEVDEQSLGELKLLAITPDVVEFDHDGLLVRYRVRQHRDHVTVSGLLGQVTFRERGRFRDQSAHEIPGSLVAPMPGTVVRIDCATGDTIEAGQSLMVLEAMKMEHVIRAPETGVLVQLPVATGAQVAAGTLLAQIEQ